MSMRVNAQRGNLKLEDGYVCLADCRLEKQLVPPPRMSPGEVELTKEHVRQQWRVVFHLFATEQDRLRQHVLTANDPLARREVVFGVQDGRDPLADAYSLLRDGGAWSDGWEIVVVGDA